MPPRANSAAARDAAYVLHPSPELKAHSQNGSLVIDRGEGVRVWDESGKEYMEAVAGLWCASLGFSNARLAEAGARAFATLPNYHTFNQRSNPPVMNSFCCSSVPKCSNMLTKGKFPTIECSFCRSLCSPSPLRVK